MQYRVLRPHEGDKFYNVGDIREASESAIKHLIPNTLEPIKAKAEKVPANKAEAAAPKNKGA